MKARPLHLASATALEVLRQRAQAAVDTWTQEWGSGPPTPVVLTVTDAINREEWQGHRYQQLRDESGGLWIRADVADRTRLTQIIIGPGSAFAPGELIEQIVDFGATA